LTSKIEAQYLVVTLVGLFFGSIYTFISFKSLVFPFLMFLLSIGGFRYLWSIQAPILPDLYLDRIMLLWLAVVFMVKIFAEGRKPRGPFLLDYLLLGHGFYIFIRIYFHDMADFHTWSMSIMVPYMVYFFAKNVIISVKQIRVLLLALLILGVYYNITSVGEKFNIPWLLYPQSMLIEHEEFVGRSCGPFRNSGIFGNTLGMILPINLYFLATVRGNFWKILLYTNLALGFVALYFTYTRGAWVVGLIAFSTAVFINRREYFKTIAPLLVVIPLAAFIGLGMIQDTFFQERVENDDTIDARVGTMVTAFRIWQDHPFVGCGPYQFTNVRDDYIEPVEFPVLGTIKFANFRNNGAHDMYFSPLAEDGLVGIFLQFSIYFLILKSFLRVLKLRKSGDHVAVYVIPLFMGILFAYLFGGLTQTFRHTSIMGTILYLVAAVAYGYRPEYRRTGSTIN